MDPGDPAQALNPELITSGWLAYGGKTRSELRDVAAVSDRLTSRVSRCHLDCPTAALTLLDVLSITVLEPRAFVLRGYGRGRGHCVLADERVVAHRGSRPCQAREATIGVVMQVACRTVIG